MTGPTVSMRTDRNNNPTAMTTDVAREGGLVLGVDYEVGESFTIADSHGRSHTLYTAKLLGDPISKTIRVIDKVGFRVGTNPFAPRWSYINIPFDIWSSMSAQQKKAVIADMYKCEGGTALAPLFGLE